MTLRTRLAALSPALLAAVFLPFTTYAAQFTGAAVLRGTTAIREAPIGSDALQFPEFGPGAGEGESPSFGSQASPASAGALRAKGVTHRRISDRGSRGNGAWASESKAERSDFDLLTTFDGLNHRNQRLANGGNQFSNEPPDQGLCVGNGYVLETVNTVLRVYDTSGNPLSGVVDLNSFYGYPPAITRATRTFGPSVFDPSCYYDPDTRRFFHVVETLEVDPVSGDLLGLSHLDIAVSATDNPLGAWNLYSIPTQNDGTQGTPDRGCGIGGPGPSRPPGPCFADYPHIGADAHGFFITSNEFELFGVFFLGANVYALPKRALAAGAPAAYVMLPTDGLAGGNPGFTVWPAVTPPDAKGKCSWEDDDGHGHRGGTEYFLSSDAVFFDSGQSDHIWLWSLTNTASLDRPIPSLFLNAVAVPTLSYAVPPLANQKAGNFPLGECINDTTASTPFGPGCWQFLFVDEPAHTEVIGAIDSNDSRMQQVMFADGKVWGALDTALKVRGKDLAGIAWFAVDPHRARVAAQGYVALPGNHLVYPAIGITSQGRGVIAFTVTGPDHYPSAGYAPVDGRRGPLPVRIAAAGLGPQDGFTEYVAESAPSPVRPRWGDYGAAAVSGDTVWIASEYIGQTCTLAQYMTTPFGSCGGTRTTLANWGTRISAVRP
jgi:hypothetical protein